MSPFHVARVGLGDKARGYKDNDLVLLCRSNPRPPSAGADEGEEEEPAAGSAAAQDEAYRTHCLALVEQSEGAQLLRLRLYLPSSSATEGDTDDEARFALVRATAAASVAHADAQQAPWYLLRLCNLSTIQREWLALHAARSLPFADVILSASQRSGASHTAWRCPGPLRSALTTRFNPSQLEAIQAGLTTAPVVLIQGPPGTGKTATLQALLSLIMHAQPAALGGHEAGSVGVRTSTSVGARERAALWRAACPWLAGSDGRDARCGEGASALGPGPAPPVRLGCNVSRTPHVLVCAPSNSALDEIVLRLLQDGLLDASGSMYTPSLVRVGVRPHPSVRAVTMDALVEERTAAQLRGARAAALAPVAGDAAAAASQAGAGLAAARAASVSSAGALERDRARLAILDDSALVASTLSFSGSGLFTRMSRSFDVVVIDEAAQAVEPSILVPLAYGCRQLFLVGDPIQLPATVLSDAAKDAGYDTSLFSRLQRAGFPVHVLKTQYRMHPEIRCFPSAEFYGEALEDGAGVAAATQRPWHAHAALGPFTFWDVNGRERVAAGTGSYVNDAEADCVLALAQAFLAASPALAVRHDGLAVVTPYRAQAALIRAKLAEALGAETALHIDVNTIDGFQGREREVVLFSVVRSPRLRKAEQAAVDAALAAGKKAPRRTQPARIGFVADERRMNVGLTRARASLAVIGSADALRGDGHWGSLVQDALARGRFVSPSQPYGAFISGLAALDSAAPLQAPSEDEDADDEPWAPAAEAHVPAGDAEEFSGDEQVWDHGAVLEGEPEGGDDLDETTIQEGGAKNAAGKRPRAAAAPGAGAKWKEGRGGAKRGR